MKTLEASWHGKFEFIPVRCGEPEGSDWKCPRGLVSEHVHEVLGDLIVDYHVYMCGPPPMLDSAEKIVVESGVARANIHADNFCDRSHTQQRG
jgi:ferredoxin-NADP reductase